MEKSPVAPQKLPHGPRAVDFRHLRGFRRTCRNSAKTGTTWRDGVKYEAPVPVAESQKLPQRYQRGGIAPFTWIPRDLSELCENGPYAVRWCGYATPGTRSAA